MRGPDKKPRTRRQIPLVQRLWARIQVGEPDECSDLRNDYEFAACPFITIGHTGEKLSSAAITLMKRRAFSSLGYPKLPPKPTLHEVAQWLEDMAISEQLQPQGRDMDAREWAATCLRAAAEDIRQVTSSI